MHPICDAPGCENESAGQISLFADGWTGALHINLCHQHAYAVVSTFPQYLSTLTDHMKK